MNLATIAWKNLWVRPWATMISLLLLVLGVSIISLLIQLNSQLDDQFKKNIRGIDMVVGAKGSPLQLVLSSVYHIDNPTGNIPLSEAKALQKHPLVAKWIPMAYGDNFKGYRILGTEWSYVEHYEAELAEGSQWDHTFETVLGADVAERTGLKVGDSFFGAHGNVEDADVHDEHAYEVVGILKRSETVLDQLVLTGMSSVWDIHDHGEEEEGKVVRGEEGNMGNNGNTGGEDGHDHGEEHGDDDHADHEDIEGEDHDHDHGEGEGHDEDHDGHDHADEEAHDHEDEDRDITAVLIKFKNPMAMMQLPRMINQETSMQAALTAIEVNRLFDLFAVGIATLRGIAWAIVIISAISVFFSLYNSLRGRKYELALMRIMGAGRSSLLLLILLEGLLLAVLGGIIGLIVSRGGMIILSGMAEEAYRYEFDWLKFLPQEGVLFIGTLLVGLLAALIPAISAYKTDISQTLREA